jgi:hypothetical protein
LAAGMKKARSCRAAWWSGIGLLEHKLEVDLAAFFGTGACEARPKVLGEQEALFANKSCGNRTGDKAEPQAKEANQQVIACDGLRRDGHADRGALGIIAYV